MVVISLKVQTFRSDTHKIQLPLAIKKFASLDKILLEKFKCEWYEHYFTLSRKSECLVIHGQINSRKKYRQQGIFQFPLSKINACNWYDLLRIYFVAKKKTRQHQHDQINSFRILRFSENKTKKNARISNIYRIGYNFVSSFQSLVFFLFSNYYR